MSCPFKSTQESDSSGSSQGVSYSNYLKVDDLLKLQVPLSESVGKNLVHDEYLFIIIHQTYELWFKLILHELESITELLLQPTLDERHTLTIVSRLGRIVKIQKVLVDQISVLETLTPRDFDNFRPYLSTSSGFQSLQFRLIENKLGVVKEKRIKHNNNDYSEAHGFLEDQKEQIRKSEEGPSLVKLIDNWLCRAPGLEKEDFHFTQKIKLGFQQWYDDLEEEAMNENDEDRRQSLLSELQAKKKRFDDFFDEERHKVLHAKGDRRLSFQALQGAYLISLYRDEPRFNQPFQILSLLMDIDTLLIKWRYNHAILVQRIIGSSVGTGGSSGYLYLLGTTSDNYRIFLDLFNLGAYIIPPQYIPALPTCMKKRLSVFHMETVSHEIDKCCCGEQASP